MEVARPSQVQFIVVAPAYGSMWLMKFCPECMKRNTIKFQFNLRQKAATSACTNAAVMSVTGEQECKLLHGFAMGAEEVLDINTWAMLSVLLWCNRAWGRYQHRTKCHP